MCACARLLLLAALPALAGRATWCAEGEVVSVTEGGGAGAGAGPAFAPRQRTAAVAAVGEAATLDCRVLRLGDKAVSWVRSRDLQILSHAGSVFTADARVSAAESHAGGGDTRAGARGTEHSLSIERLRVADSGRYECQINTEPKMSLLFNLTVLDEPVPSVVVSAAGPATVRARGGGAATLACEARYQPAPRALPVPPLDVRWHRAGAADTDAGATENYELSLQSSRGGVSLETERWAARVVSRLTLADARAGDAGVYVCAAGAGARSAGAEASSAGAGARSAALRLIVADTVPFAPHGINCHCVCSPMSPPATIIPARYATRSIYQLLEDEHTEMQRDAAASGAGGGGAGGALSALSVAVVAAATALR